MTDRIDHGGWVLVPTEEVALPRVVLTEEQLAENTEAEVRYAETKRKIDELVAQLRALGCPVVAERTVDEYDDEYGYGPSKDDLYPDFVLPHNPEAYDFTKFGPREWAYANYLQDRPRFQGMGPREAVARELVKQGFKMRWEFAGMSAGAWPIPEKDKPPLPEWAK